MEIEDDDDLLKFDSDMALPVKKSSPSVHPITQKDEQNKLDEIPQKEIEPKEQKDPIWLSLSKGDKKPKGNILSNALKNTNPEKVPLWFRELDTKETEKPRKVADFEVPEKLEVETPPKESPKEVVRTSRSRGSLDITKSAQLEKVAEPVVRVESVSRNKSRSKSRPKRPQVIYNSGYSETSPISNETFDSLMKFKYSHLGRLKPLYQQSNN